MFVLLSYLIYEQNKLVENIIRNISRREGQYLAASIKLCLEKFVVTVAKEKIGEVSLNIVCTRIILIHDAKSVSRNILK